MNTVMIARKCDIVDEEGKVTSGILLMEISESLLDQMLGEMVGRPNIWDDPWWKKLPPNGIFAQPGDDAHFKVDRRPIWEIISTQ